MKSSTRKPVDILNNSTWMFKSVYTERGIFKLNVHHYFHKKVKACNLFVLPTLFLISLTSFLDWKGTSFTVLFHLHFVFRMSNEDEPDCNILIFIHNLSRNGAIPVLRF